MRWIKLIVLLVLSAAGVHAAGPFDCIPEQAALAVRMRTARFFAAEPLRALTESGDVSRIHEELTLIPWMAACLMWYCSISVRREVMPCWSNAERNRRS